MQSPPEDPDGSFLNKPHFTLFTSFTLHEIGDKPRPDGSLFLLGWSVRLILANTLMKDASHVWTPAIGDQIPDGEESVGFNYRLLLSENAVSLLRGVCLDQLGQLQMRVTALHQPTSHPIEYVGSFTLYLNRVNHDNVTVDVGPGPFEVGVNRSTLSVPKKRRWL